MRYRKPTNEEEFRELWDMLIKKNKKEADRLRRWWNHQRYAAHGYPHIPKFLYEPDPVRDVPMSEDEVTIDGNGEVTVGGILH